MAEIEKTYFPDKATQAAIKSTVDSIKTTTDTTKNTMDSIKATTDATKTNVDSVKTSTASIASKQDTLMQKIQSGDLKRKVAIFTTPGTHYWTCPEGVTAVKLTMFGGGGGGGVVRSRSDGGTWRTYGGNGGNYVFQKFVTVTQGTTYPLIVGAGGLGGSANMSEPPYNGKASTGGTSSAFGQVCAGGVGGGDSIVKNAHPTTNLVSLGAISTIFGITMDPSPTYCSINGSKPGSSYTDKNNINGGAPGYGDGGAATMALNQNTPVYSIAGFGAGGGGMGLTEGTPTSSSIRGNSGGNGIIIIEY